MNNNIKIILGCSYFIVVFLFLFGTFYFNINFDNFLNLIENNNNKINQLGELYFLKISLIFFLFSIIWTFFLGIGLPLFLFTAFFYNIFMGCILLVFSRSLGATCMYFFIKKFFISEVKKYIKKKNILNKKLYKKIDNNKFKFFLTIRMIPGIPYQITDILPIIFNMKLQSYFLAKFFGSLFSNFIIIYMFSNLFKKLGLKYNDSLLDINLSLFISVILFITLLICGYIYKKKFLNKD